MERANLGWTNPTDSTMSNAGTICPHFGQALVVISGAVLGIGYVVLLLI